MAASPAGASRTADAVADDSAAHLPAQDSAPPLRHNRPYVLLQAGKTAQLVGAGVGAFAVPLLAYQVTGSVAQAGLIAGIGQAGALLATLPAGVLADRANRRTLIVVATALGALLWGSLAAAAVADALTGWHLALVLFCSSALTDLATTAGTGAIRAVVTPAQMPQAMAVTQARQAVAALLAGPVGGFLYGVAHFLPLGASALGHLVETVCAWLVHRPLNGDLAAARSTHPLAAMRDGLRFVWSRSLFRVATGMFVVINVAFGAMLVAINLELVRTGTLPLLIGLVDLVIGGTMLAGSVLAGPLLGRFRVGPLVVVGLAMIALCAVGMSLLQSYVAYLVLFGLAVVLLPAANAGLGGYVAAITPLQMQGRVSSVLGLTGVLAAPVAPVLGSLLLEAGGVGVALATPAAVLVLVVVALAFFRPLWRIGKPDTWGDDAIAWPPAGGTRQSVA